MADEYQQMQDETVFFFVRPVSSFFRAPRQGPVRAPKIQHTFYVFFPHPTSPLFFSLLLYILIVVIYIVLTQARVT